jgi:hypothetical protein
MAGCVAEMVTAWKWTSGRHGKDIERQNQYNLRQTVRNREIADSSQNGWTRETNEWAREDLSIREWLIVNAKRRRSTAAEMSGDKNLQIFLDFNGT